MNPDREWTLLNWKECGLKSCPYIRKGLEFNFYTSYIHRSYLVYMDTTFHKSLDAAKSFVRKKIGRKGTKRFQWVELQKPVRGVE